MVAALAMLLFVGVPSALADSATTQSHTGTLATSESVFQTTVTSTVWDAAEKMWHIGTDRGDHLKAKFVICANGTLSKPKLSKIKGMETFKGHSFHTSLWDYEYCGPDLSKLSDKVVGIIGT